ncbi:TRAP transporter substrate-binding protein DctP [Neptunomonas antarctica]|uniref:TRAP-type C4-dicarboxylate transport system, substrate-binding protein n=1 Tax=Neptunomonas antarctica TaxID=619304 RepID=A0A1N7N6N0_9GAMM|nr:TRAP transporter substrate-binding protein DctP [Neptunomonas antarctica]SIS93994.1 TRAP-type C4-dicarboxylate transport system, substrate-binding protein [Neptunomonas antarctica]
MNLKPIVLACSLVGVSLMASTVQAEMLKASHQFPGGKGDVRDEMMKIVSNEITKADVDLTMRIYPGGSLFKAKDQWVPLTKGLLDMTLVPLAYAAGKHPQFDATLMPGLVKNHAHAARLSDSPFMEAIKEEINDAGAIVLADTWMAGGFASAKKCILEPEDAEGQTFRAAGKAFERMLAGAGASIASMPSSEIYTAMQTGVIDAANTSSASFVSYRLDEQVKCLTAPGENALWFMYEPLLISKITWNKLNAEQQAALTAAGDKAEKYFFEEAKGLDQKMVDAFTKSGVEVVTMTTEQADKWKAIAQNTSYKVFAEQVPGGKELIDLALSVE